MHWNDCQACPLTVGYRMGFVRHWATNEERESTMEHWLSPMSRSLSDLGCERERENRRTSAPNKTI